LKPLLGITLALAGEVFVWWFYFEQTTLWDAYPYTTSESIQRWALFGLALLFAILFVALLALATVRGLRWFRHRA
jgi:hypothetical protein